MDIQIKRVPRAAGLKKDAAACQHGCREVVQLRIGANVDDPKGDSPHGAGPETDMLASNVPDDNLQLDLCLVDAARLGSLLGDALSDSPDWQAASRGEYWIMRRLARGWRAHRFAFTLEEARHKKAQLEQRYPGTVFKILGAVG